MSVCLNKKTRPNKTNFLYFAQTWILSEGMFLETILHDFDGCSFMFDIFNVFLLNVGFDCF